MGLYSLLFKTYVRPILEFGTEIFNPIQVKFINALERPQHCFTRFAIKKCGLPKSPYLERFLDTLESRRFMQDLSTYFQLCSATFNIDSVSFLPLPSTEPSRKHHKKFVPNIYNIVSHLTGLSIGQFPSGMSCHPPQILYPISSSSSNS